ncbi:MAG: hypothetical protein ACT4P1_03720 [Sporichthyaceae bacterium]
MTDAVRLNKWTERMRICLSRLSSPPAVQISYLQDLGVGDLADELALEFDDTLRPLAPLLEQLSGAQQILLGLRRIDCALNDPDLAWTFEDLAASPAWIEIRALASSALHANWEIVS